ncbi:VanZ family protein [Bacillus salacetis]|uniref:VanZ family protein n=1 Tax=Bacillus salacetis TaxID=2315464 RepID=A0A3A1R6W3_9BACI|nr:VanZ family protein [Bacillus salacetis]RIW37251.1 VanZ family protein [Bacillus salacetis]
MKKSLMISQILFVLLSPVWLKLTEYLHSIVVAVVWFCYTFSALFIICLVKQLTVSFQRRVLHVLTSVYAAGLLVLLFFRPNGQRYESYSLSPFETISFYFSGEVDFLIAFYNLAANIGLFVPFGLYYVYTARHPSAVKLLAFSLTGITMIEIMQFITHRGSLDIDDLMLNTIGVLLGYMIFPVFQKVFKLKD